MKKMLSMGLLVTLLLTGCGTSKNSDVKDSLADGVLTVGLECDYAPYNWTTNEAQKSDSAVSITGSVGYCDGYDVMIAQKIADELGVTLEIKKISWDGLIPALNTGQIDAIIAGMSPTEERKQTISFSNDYFKENPVQVVVVNKDSEFANATLLSDFAGANITAQQGTLQVKLLEQLTGIKRSAELPDYATLMKALNAGTIDGYIAELAVANEHVQANPNFKMIEFGDDNGFVLSEGDTTTAIGVRKNDTDLQSALNRALDTIDQASREALMKKASEMSGVSR